MVYQRFIAILALGAFGVAVLLICSSSQTLGAGGMSEATMRTCCALGESHSGSHQLAAVLEGGPRPDAAARWLNHTDTSAVATLETDSNTGWPSSRRNLRGEVALEKQRLADLIASRPRPPSGPMSGQDVTVS